MIMNKEIVDKDKALDIALKIASDRENYFDRLEEGLYGLSLEEQNLVLALTYIVLLSRQFGMPKELIKGQMNKINTTQVHNKKNFADFKKWVECLEDLGYSNYYADLNAKDYGVPQNRNRTFMISILGDYYYQFPEPFKLQNRLKDILAMILCRLFKNMLNIFQTKHTAKRRNQIKRKS